MGTTPGLQTDCETLLSRFQEMDSVRFEDFAELWRSMKFATIFCGKMRNLKKNMFTKEALALAWRYFLPPHTFQIRVGALYLLYGLYNTQLCQPKQKIRVALKDWDEIIRFQQDLINAQHFDAAFVFRKLRLDRAFHFTAMPKLQLRGRPEPRAFEAGSQPLSCLPQPFSPFECRELSCRMKKKVQQTEVTQKFKDPNDRVMKLITSDVLEEMLNVHDHYQNMKHAISADKSMPDKALSLVKEDFFDNIKNIVLEHQEWYKERKNPSLKPKLKEGEENGEGTSEEPEVEMRESSVFSENKSKSLLSCRPGCPSPGGIANPSLTLLTLTLGLDKCKAKQLREGEPENQQTRQNRPQGGGPPGAKGNVSNEHKEEKTLRLSMPVITEEEDDDMDGFSRAGHCTQEEEKMLTQEAGGVLHFELSNRRNGVMLYTKQEVASED
ncbi:snRNA-activating protein complex subunit 1 [Apodemus speciosus]|uniref:snRNA-activating protein complex subunit 1 n=1 Tax=Apodemus speciosus TaxID=105296 RepID=A0ABQ0FE91_APOSI